MNIKMVSQWTNTFARTSDQTHAIFALWPQVQINPSPRLHNMDKNIEERKQKQEEISPFLKTLTLKHKRRYLKIARCTILCATQQPIAPEVLDCRHQDIHLLYLQLVFRVPLSHILVLVVCCIALHRSSS
jgi:hypothetical protein